MLFQDTLKELRKNKGISQYDLAESLNISRSVVAKWEIGLTLPNEENVSLLMKYFNVTREELFKNEETETVIVKKNVSISKMKKVIVSLSTAIAILLIASVIIITSLMPKSLAKELDKLGDFEDVKISLYCFTTDETYYLDVNEKNIHDEVLYKLNNIEYKLYPKYILVEKWIGEYTIILEGDITIYLNQGYMIIDGNNRAVKNYNPDSLYEIVQILISSESIEIYDEVFNK
mgnify:CR=1 FL=1